MFNFICNFTKKETLDRCFPVNFAKFLRTPIFTEHKIYRDVFKTMSKIYHEASCKNN